MKKTNLLYWTFTGLFAALMLSSSIPDVLNLPDAVKFITSLQLPAYFAPMLGWAKILGVIAILIPGFPRIKEWAYAGFAFDFLFASISYFAVEGVVFFSFFPYIFLGILAVSYIYYNKIND